MSELRTNRIVPRDGLASGMSGGIIQVKSATKTDTQSISGTGSSADITGLSVSITPSSASNKILITGQMMVSNVNSNDACVNLVIYKAGSALTAATGDAGSGQKRVTSAVEVDYDYGLSSLPFQYLDTAGGTSSITYQPALNTHHSGGNTVYVNRTYDDTADESYLRGISVITVMEISA